jgi:deoxyribodipyrimidine photo-lyase
MTSPALLWFRNDLRLSDHAALRAAMAGGGPILPVFVLDDAAAGQWAMGAASRWWLHHSLAALAGDLAARGASLMLCRGSALEAIPRIAAAVAARDVYTGGGAEPWARQLDRAVADALAKQCITMHRHRTMMLYDPTAMRTNSANPYSVYTPFARACLTGAPPPQPSRVPKQIASIPPPWSDNLADWSLLPTQPDWAAGLRSTWTPGERGAQQRLRQFVTGALADYRVSRDIPAANATSMLSPHVHFGEISPAQLWHAAQGDDTFIRELLWREFAMHLLWHHPNLPQEPLKPEFAAMPWRSDPSALRAWQRGRTGIPIVDAGMRQLWQIGWMHNRVRMIAASFLVKHLLLPWQEGAAWFWDTLVDADLANNSMGWQWVAGSGADAAPWFRVFNPVLQGGKFDPDGAYVRRFVPELARLPADHIHAPWHAPDAVLAGAGVTLGSTYPYPTVDLAAGRARALAAHRSLRGSSPVPIC